MKDNNNQNRNECEDDIKRLASYEMAIADYRAGHISLDTCLGWIHYHDGVREMTYDRYISLGVD